MAWNKESNLVEADFVEIWTADKITDISNVDYGSITVTGIAIDGTKAYCFSVHVLKDEDETRFAAMRLRFSTYVYENSDVMLNTKTGAIKRVAGITPTLLGAEDLDTHWRFYVAVIPNVNNTLLDITIWPAITGVYAMPFNPTITGSIIVSDAQVSEGAELQPYVKTAGVAAVGPPQNLLLWSEDFSQWTSYNATVETNVGSSPATGSWPVEDAL